MKHDFYKILVEEPKRGQYVVSANFLLTYNIKDLMIRGKDFYAVLNKETGLWSTNPYDLIRWVDEELYDYANQFAKKKNSESEYSRVTVRALSSYKTKAWLECRKYLTNMPDSYHILDSKLCFSNTQVKPEDYVSKQLPYPLEKGNYDAWDEIVGTLYDPEEREKIEWCIGAVVSGDSRSIQKFLVFNGDPGAGKGTILKVIRKLFDGYCASFNAKSLTQSSKDFALETFRNNPLVAIQEDGDLSKIEDNTKLNSVVSHETMEMNEKYKSSYDFTPRAFLFMASNKPVKITDAKSGIIRRLIDVRPNGNHIERSRYDMLMAQIDFELSGIAWHCLEVYREKGKKYYDGYRPMEMIYQTDPFFNFMEFNYDTFATDNGVSLKNAYAMWKEYCEASGVNVNLYKMYELREELKSYFKNFDELTRIDGVQVRSYYSDFIKTKFKNGVSPKKRRQGQEEKALGLVLDQTVSPLDDILKDCLAQYGEKKGDGSKPKEPWSKVKSKLCDLDTKQLHFVLLPKNHIVIDFDLKNEKGEKDRQKNLEAAAKWPRTYAEFSQGGNGVHLHYIYDGNVEELDSLYDKDIEVKVYSGHASLRRKLSLCNNLPVAVLNCGLPRKEVSKVIDFEAVKDEKHLRAIIAKCLKKETKQPYTKPCMDLIKKTLDDAYKASLNYDIRDMRPAIMAFASKSHNQKEVCLRIANDLHYSGKLQEGNGLDKPVRIIKEKVQMEQESDLVFYDIEVYPNLLLICWKESGEGKPVHSLTNPTKEAIEHLMKMKLVGFNCRRYDNHVIYARYLGYNNDQIYRLSQRIINGSQNAMFGNAYDISYTDVYDFAAKKQSLKKWEIELGIHHQEMGIPWDQPVLEDRWNEVIGYCSNDVIATEAVFNHLSGDFQARKILAEIAGMNVNATTNQLTTRIIFGDAVDPQKQFIYPDLKKKFPGYVFENGKSYYKGELIGEGGRVYAVPGIYHNVITFDVASMHPHSIIAENGFGPFTERFKQLLDIRIAIKHKDYETASKMLDGKLAKFLTDKDQAKALSQALKIAINSVYGLTAASFDNKFRDPRNIDNWVAKRGALFMETLRLKVLEMGGKVVHIKTDSIKVEEPSEEIKRFIIEYGHEYGYTFEIEDIYEKICLVNDAVYIALRDRNDPGWLDECDKAQKNNKPIPTRWAATGAQFMHPYVFKKLFSHEPIEFDDLCETKTVTSALYLDLNEKLSDVSEYEKDLEKTIKRVKTLLKIYGYPGSYDDWRNNKIMLAGSSNNISDIDKEQINEELKDLYKDVLVLEEMIAEGHNYVFVGKAGRFCPIKSGFNGGILCREKDGKFYAATGSKGYRWQEGERLQSVDRMDLIDMTYFDSLAEDAKEAIKVYGDFDQFVSEEPANNYLEEIENAELKHSHPDTPPWAHPCGEDKYAFCSECSEYYEEDGMSHCHLGYNLNDYYWAKERKYNEQLSE